MTRTEDRQRRNPPGQPEIHYRIGTHASFLRRMLEALPRYRIPDGDHAGTRPLARLTTRASGDPAIAWLDAFATVADVLAFYQERIANEGFLPTAIERRSVLELARAIGYELNPGVAAGTFLAFTLEDAEGAPRRARVATGVKIGSVPGQDEKPQTFETVESIEARAEWNALVPRTSVAHVPGFGARELYVKGVTTNLEPGDAILIVGDERLDQREGERWDFRILDSVEAFPPSAGSSGEGYTRLHWRRGLGRFRPFVRPTAANPKVYAFRQRAALFGHNAPDFRAMPDAIKGELGNGIDAAHSTEWKDFAIRRPNEEEIRIYLDALYPRILVGSWIALVRPEYRELYRVTEAKEASRTDFMLTAKTTRLELDVAENLEDFGLRETVVYAQSEELEWAQRPLTTPVRGREIELDRVVPHLERGRAIVVEGKVAGEEAVSEVGFVDSCESDRERTLIRLKSGLAGVYDRVGTRIMANVVRATHGETVEREVLGAGDGSVPNQHFDLKKPPLTFVSASTASGAESTLEIRVNGVEWKEVPYLYGLGPEAESFVVRLADDGTARVIFGDGESGARLPTGAENVVATYRSGIGLEGELPASKLTLLQTRPLGVREVTNPLPATGAADPETLDDARRNAPLTVRTLDRIVSLADYEDFARAFAGIGKAEAANLWDGDRRIIHITVATTTGGPLDDPTLEANLRQAIARSRDPDRDVRIQSFEPRSFDLVAQILVDERLEVEKVLEAVASGLRARFAFAERAFGQPVTAAEVTEVVHRVEGVIAVDIDRLHYTGAPPTRQEILASARARLERGVVRAAQLLLVNPNAVDLREMQR